MVQINDLVSDQTAAGTVMDFVTRVVSAAVDEAIRLTLPIDDPSRLVVPGKGALLVLHLAKANSS